MIECSTAVSLQLLKIWIFVGFHKFKSVLHCVIEFSITVLLQLLKIWVLIGSILEHCMLFVIGFKMTICNSF